MVFSIVGREKLQGNTLINITVYLGLLPCFKNHKYSIMKKFILIFVFTLIFISGARAQTEITRYEYLYNTNDLIVSTGNDIYYAVQYNDYSTDKLQSVTNGVYDLNIAMTYIYNDLAQTGYENAQEEVLWNTAVTNMSNLSEYFGAYYNNFKSVNANNQSMDELQEVFDGLISLMSLLL